MAWEEMTPETLAKYDGKIMLCKPIKHGIPRAELRKIERETGAPYKAVGAIEAECDFCNEGIYIGPRQQEHREDDTPEICYNCYFALGGKPDAPNMHHAGGI